ncbi:MAG: 16S rRNA (guanine(527)-N(7))-methyltransferase RsmG [Actinomycetaceae bacterium]|nr:16S rRNA (guanine(527)-N(7))-methyltransferase RsmG [Actinomycetaceae bacterium]MDU0969956.1 16S rRNA (guanine(527)-N(7))-methyltransferase RsmG [Actinomycetaceae bacterium]
MSDTLREDSSAADAVPVEVPNQQVKDYFGPAFPAIEYYGRMITDEGELRGLIGPRELPRLWSRHLLNCAAVTELIPETGDITVADVGSGVGLPGIVVACMRPEAQVVLIEAMERRVAWLGEVVTELDLDNVDIVHARSNDLPRRVKFDYVTSRAVANMSKLVRISGRLVAGGGSLLALKGRRAADEVAAAQADLKKAGLIDVRIHEVPNLMDPEPSRVVEARKRR